MVRNGGGNTNPQVGLDSSAPSIWYVLAALHQDTQAVSSPSLLTERDVGDTPAGSEDKEGKMADIDSLTAA